MLMLLSNIVMNAVTPRRKYLWIRHWQLLSELRQEHVTVQCTLSLPLKTRSVTHKLMPEPKKGTGVLQSRLDVCSRKPLLEFGYEHCKTSLLN